jgi:hypothetical protein
MLAKVSTRPTRSIHRKRRNCSSEGKHENDTEERDLPIHSVSFLNETV